jgi:hypothetical protein
MKKISELPKHYCNNRGDQESHEVKDVKDLKNWAKSCIKELEKSMSPRVVMHENLLSWAIDCKVVEEKIKFLKEFILEEK